jgi:hypothetical protein
VRLAVSLDANHDGTPEATATSFVLGWQRRSFDVQHQTYSVPFLRPPVFTGTIDSIAGTIASVANSAASTSVSALMVSGREYYLDVLSGSLEGNRWEVDEAASTATSIALLPADAKSTRPDVPQALAGSLIALRPHWQVGDLFPTTVYHATNNATTADNLVFFDNSTGAYSTLWLANAPSGKKWVVVGDATLTSQNNRTIASGEGLFARPRTSVVSGLWFGVVRSSKFACPLNQGMCFTGNPYPLSQSFNSRLMTAAAGFTGSNNANLADKVYFWAGDAGSVTSYNVYYLLKSGAIERWLKVGDATLTNHAGDQLFVGGRATFVYSIHAQPNWIMPLPWTP